MIDWDEYIINLSSLKRKLFNLDKEKIWENDPPNIAAEASVLKSLEKKWGYPLNSKYKDFLLTSNGWDSFFVGMDLFGTSELFSGNKRLIAEELLDFLEPNILNDMKAARHELYPIAVAEQSISMLVASQSDERIFWVSGYVIEEYKDFEEMFLLVLEHHLDEVKDLLISETSR